MRVLITGGTGFIGLAVSEAATRAGHAAVLFGANRIPDTLPRPNWLDACRIVIGDVRSDADLAAAFEDGIDRVVHAAAVTPDAEREAREPAVIAEVNLLGTIRVIEKAKASDVRRIVTLSSVAAY